MRKLIEEFEGCKLEPYADAVGVPTVGFGHTGGDVSLGMDPISQEQADQLLAADLQRFEQAVTEMAPTTSQQQFDALVSFSYNLGEGALRGSSLLRFHNAGQYDDAANEFGKWNHAGGQVLAGLTRRRAAESACYADGVYSSDAPSNDKAGTTSSQPILRMGSSGDAVSALQTKLGITADGAFGTHTDAVVKQFQTNNGLAPDGIVGPQTWAKLEAVA
jgi:lysozyme